MSRHICAECRYRYCYIYKPKTACMNEKSERYGEAIEPSDYCEEWEDRRADGKERVDAETDNNVCNVRLSYGNHSDV